jgi:hypothetical protein
MKTETVKTGHTNPDAITGAPASHPGATGIGSASGAAAGAALGAIGVAGHSIGEWNDPSDAAYWKSEYKNRKYFDKGADYENDVVPALSYGSRLRSSRTDSTATFASVEDKVKANWDKVRGNSKYSYDQARPLISDAYERQV